MIISNKEDYTKDAVVYKMLLDLEDAIQGKSEFTISVMVARLAQKGLTFEVSFEETDPQVQ
jgi:hypothetical protein